MSQGIHVRLAVFPHMPFGQEVLQEEGADPCKKKGAEHEVQPDAPPILHVLQELEQLAQVLLDALR